MKNFSLFFSSIIAVTFLMACGGDTTTSNKYLGKYPSMVKNYLNKIEKKEKEIKECTDMQKTYKLTKEQDLLEDKVKKEIKEHLELHPITNTDLPFVAIESPNYKLTKVVVNRTYATSLNLKFMLNIKQDIKNEYGGIERSLFIYYKAVDNAGNDIPNTKTVAVNFKRMNLKAGIKYEAFGSWNDNSIANMEDFAKVMQISEQEYEGKKYSTAKTSH